MPPIDMATNYLALRSSAVPALNAVNLTLSTLTGSTITALSTFTAPAVLFSTLKGSTMTGLTLSISTLTVSSINNNAPGTGTGAFSTLTVSSLVSVSSIQTTSTLYTSSMITTGNVGIGTASPATTLDVAGIIQGQTAFQSSTSANNVGMGALQTVYLGQYDAAAPRATSVRIGDVLGAAYYMTTGSYNLSFYKDVSGGNAVTALQIIGIGATNTSPNVYIPNSLGIGTASPASALHVIGAITSSGAINSSGNVTSVGVLALFDAPTPANGFLRITTASGSNYIQSGLTGVGDSKADLVFGSMFAGSEWMRIKSTGYVGIGTATPTYPLSLMATNLSATTGTNISTTFEIAGNQGSGGVYSGQYGGYLEGGVNVGQNTYLALGYINTQSNIPVKNEMMRIVDTGRIGIGTTSPSALLHIHGAQLPTTPLIVTNTSNVSQQLMFGTSWGGAYTSSYSSVQSIVQGTAYNSLALNSLGGNVGIGMTNPTQPLDVNGTIARNGFKLPRVDYGTFTAGATVSVPLLFSDTQYSHTEIRIHYWVSAQCNITMSATDSTPTTLNFEESSLTTYQWNAQAAVYYNKTTDAQTSFTFATNVETAGIDNLVVIRITRATGTGATGFRNHYMYENVYCIYGVGTARGYGMGHINLTSTSGPQLGSFKLTASTGNISGNYTTTHYN